MCGKAKVNCILGKIVYLAKLLTMKILLTTLFTLACIFGYSQKYNCDIRQIELEAYEYALANLDSIKKHTPQPQIAVTAQVTITGELEKLVYSVEDKKVKVWKGLENALKNLFSLCQDSPFYNAAAQVTKAAFVLPLEKEKLSRAINSIKTTPGYTAPGTSYKPLGENAKYTIDIKRLIVSLSGIAPIQVSGELKEYTSGMVKITDEFYLVLTIDTKSDPNVTYLAYKVIEARNYKGVVITKETKRPLVNGKAHLSVTGERLQNREPEAEDKHFDIEMDITFE